MPRRKAASANGDAPAVKKTRSSPGTGVETQWEWEADGNEWTAFSTELQEQLNSAKGEITVKIGSTKFKLSTDKNIQKNAATGFERRIRPALKSTVGSDYNVWDWKDDYGHWCAYTRDAAVALETALVGGTATVPLNTGGRATYTADVKRMKQVNDATGFERDMRRTKSDCENPKEEEKNEEETEEDTEKPKGRKSAAASGRKGKSAGKSGSGKKGKSTGGASNVVEEETVKTVVVKGAAPVDPECTAKLGTAHVFVEGSDIYDVMLNQTNVQNNNNKYFVIQLLEDDAKKAYSVWFRWGRVGFKGQNNLVPCGPDLEQAKKLFCKKFRDKTVNDWADRKSFSKVPGKYDLLEMDYGSDKNGKSVGDDEAGPSTPDNVDGDLKVPESVLDTRLQDLIRLICDVKSMEDAVVEMKYDAKKAPLGKLTSQQIKAGYAALKVIDECVSKGQFGKQHLQACNDFYTRIPHYFGMRTPPLIRTKEEVKAKLNLLEALDDIEVAMKILKRSSSTENPVDTRYKGLDVDLDPIDSAHADFKMIEDYVRNTHASTHNHYSMKVLDVFACDKKREAAQYNDVGNRMLLWHGSRLTNWVGILNQGLRIAPPEAPVTGYMFGKGVYFADMSSKSANYCFATRSKNVGMLLLCEVSLGNMNELLNADYNADRLPSGKHSVWGKGRVAPDSKKLFTTTDGMLVPLGKPVDTKVVNPAGYTLNYNEFIVYNVNQIRMKYLVKVQFNFK